MSNNKIKRTTRKLVKKKVNKEDDSAITIMDNLIEQHKHSIIQLKELRKKYLKDTQTKIKIKKDKQTGFAKKTITPDSIADFLGLDKDIELSRSDVFKKIYQELKRRGLCYKKDKRVLRVDDEVCEMFDLTLDVNNVIDPKDPAGFNLFNLQKKIADCYKNN